MPFTRLLSITSPAAIPPHRDAHARLRPGAVGRPPERPRAAALLLALTLLATGCASLPPTSGRELRLGDPPHGDSGPALTESSDDRDTRAPDSPPQPESPTRLRHRRSLRVTSTRVDVAREAHPAEGPAAQDAQQPTAESVALARQAVLAAVDEVKGSTGGVATA
ncbi:hypothetical protein ACLESO_59085, partial [Pyxidicoccus sp. 3LG]